MNKNIMFNCARPSSMTLLTMLWLAAEMLNGQSTSEHVNIPLSDPSARALVRVETVNGGITVQGSDGKSVIVEAHVQQNASGTTAGVRLAPDELSVTEDNNQVRITSYTMKRQIDLTILVPRHSSLTLSAVNHGAITVSDIEGEIEANNVNGAVTLRNISGNAVAHSLNAAVLVTFRSVSSEKPMAFSSMNGVVDVTFPSDIRADVSLQSGHGKVYTDFDIQPDAGGNQPLTEEIPGGEARYRVKADRTIHGTINGGGPELQFKNFNGSIYVRKAPV